MAKKQKKEPTPKVSVYDRKVPEQEEIRVVTNKDGVLEGINSKGEVVWTEKCNKKKFAISRRLNAERKHSLASRQHFIEDDAGNKVLVPWHITAGKLRNLAYPYSEEIAIAICAKITEGETMKAICSDDHFPPYYVINYWKGRYPEFRKMMEEAKRARAEIYHDEIVEVAETVDEDNSKSAKVKIDAYKHLAAVNNPEEYGPRTKISGDLNAPLSFVISTGIDRSEPQPEAIPAEARTVEEEDGSSTDEDDQHWV
jgi:hypothetical protein